MYSNTSELNTLNTVMQVYLFSFLLTGTSPVSMSIYMSPCPSREIESVLIQSVVCAVWIWC